MGAFAGPGFGPGTNRPVPQQAKKVGGPGGRVIFHLVSRIEARRPTWAKGRAEVVVERSVSTEISDWRRLAKPNSIPVNETIDVVTRRRRKSKPRVLSVYKISRIYEAYRAYRAYLASKGDGQED